MKFGLNLPNIHVGDDPRQLGELAREAEAAGWDGAFVWDAGALGPGHPDYPQPQSALDAWVCLAAMALATERIRLGPLVAPLARHRPWELARRILTLDQLSRGRMTLVAGNGDPHDGFFRDVSEPIARAERVERLEEGLAIIDGLQSGEPFSHAGAHFRVDGLVLRPGPVQRPRVPIWRWAGAASGTSVRRALRWDGAFFWSGSPSDVAAARTVARDARGGASPYEIIVESPLDRASPGPPPDSTSQDVRPFADAGATWWLESSWKCAEPPNGSYELLRERIRRGPPLL